MLNSFDNWHYPRVVWKVTLSGLRVRITEMIIILLKQLQKLKYGVDVFLFFFLSLKRFSVFEWIQIIVAVAGELRHTMEPSPNTGQIPF